VNCSTLGVQTRALLHLILLPAHSRNRKGLGRVLRDDVAGWALALNLTTGSVTDALDDLVNENVLLYDEEANRYTIIAPCDCASASKVSLGSTAGSSEDGGLLPSNGSAIRLSPAFGGQGQTPKKSLTRTNAGLEEVLTGLAADDHPVSEWGSRALADYFREVVFLAARRSRLKIKPGAFNDSILTGNISRWLKEPDHNPESIKAMIDHFADDYRRYHKPAADPAKVFVANRGDIFAKVDRAKEIDLSRDIDVLMAGRNFARPIKKNRSTD
jgi:hypothetical protein